MPEEAAFCPNCGAPAEEKASAPSQPLEEARGVEELLKAGALGIVLSVAMNVLSPANLYFLPSFLASLVAVYAFRIQRLGESLATAFMIYLMTDGILGTLILGMFYYTNTPFEISFVPGLWEALSYTISPITAFFAGYVGAKVFPKRPPRKEREGPGGVIYSY